MAKQIHPFTIDRRKLLLSSAAISATAIVPSAGHAEATNPMEGNSMAAATEMDTPAWNVCAVTARRIEEIVARNRIRQDAGLPLLSIPKELRRLKKVADAAEFEGFAARYRQAVLDEVLRPVREAKDDPTWRPIGWMERLGYEGRVSKILHERFIAQQHFERLNGNDRQG